MPSDRKPPDRRPAPEPTLDLFAPRPSPSPPPPREELRPVTRAAEPAPRAALQHGPPVAASLAPIAHPVAQPPSPAIAAPPFVATQHAPREEPRVYMVSEAVRLAARSLEARFPDVWVEGEISNLKVYNGSCYFTLKDEASQLAAVLWAQAAQRLPFRPTDGLKVRARGTLTVYDAQGRFQLRATTLEPAGLGALQLALDQLKQRLRAEGLFDERRKRPLPFLPRRIGVATSHKGAAVRDIIRVALARGPARIVVSPCAVQGDDAPGEIVRAIAALERLPDVDLIIVGRGGGSVEDLWAFNDERVARAIAACRVPVISAVGHEVDFTIADFVADRRAATPSQAAELAVPVHRELSQRLSELRLRLGRAMARRAGDARLRLDGLVESLEAAARRAIEGERRRLRAAETRLAPLHPSARIARDRARLDALRRHLERPLPERIARERRALLPLARRLDAALQQTLAARGARLPPLDARLHAAMQQRLAVRHRGFSALVGKLDALSPLRVLERGYAVVRGEGGHVLLGADEVRAGEAIFVRLARGTIAAQVTGVDAPAPDPARDDADAIAAPPLPGGRPHDRRPR